MKHYLQLDGRKTASMCAQARHLLEAGVATPGDTLIGMRGAMECLRGTVGRLSQLTLSEATGGNPTFSWCRYVPFRRPPASPAGVSPPDATALQPQAKNQPATTPGGISDGMTCSR